MKTLRAPWCLSGERPPQRLEKLFAVRQPERLIVVIGWHGLLSCPFRVQSMPSSLRFFLFALPIVREIQRIHHSLTVPPPLSFQIRDECKAGDRRNQQQTYKC